MDWLKELNQQQRKAVEHKDGPLLVVAGAGTGKTRTLAYRVAHLISSGIRPDRILLLTFTRRSAEEMLKRASSIMSHGPSVAGHVWSGTFHAIGNRLLRIYAEPAGIDPAFTVMDRGDSEDIIHSIKRELTPQQTTKKFPQKRTCMAIYSRCVNAGDSLDDVVNRFFPWCIEWKDELKELFNKYVLRKQEQNLLDYDDLLLYWSGLVENETLGNQIGGMFDHILVDEYQDTNRIQAGILKNMRRETKNIMAVGDDAQSIYSFRAADVRNMLNFKKHFPEATVITLEQNYRSVMPILETTNLLISHATERYTKDLWSERKSQQKPCLIMCNDENSQDQWTVKKILSHYEQGIPLKEQAVLFRAGHLSDSLEIELSRNKIPYRKYGGLRFLEAAHIKDLICLLRIIENPRDQMAWTRTLLLMPGIGAAAASRAVRHIAEHGHDPRAIKTFDFPTAAHEHKKPLISMINNLVEKPELTPSEQIELVRKFYNPLLEKTYENPSARAGDIENLERISLSYKSRRAFLTDLQLDPPNSTSDIAGAPLADDDYVILSTIHSAKGCEWDVVFLIHAAEGCLPSDMASGSETEIAEEMRLTYVAMTRARNFLYVSWPLRYYQRRRKPGDAYGLSQLSRFFSPDVRATLESLSPEQDRLAETLKNSGETPQLNIRGSLKDMWK